VTKYTFIATLGVVGALSFALWLEDRGLDGAYQDLAHVIDKVGRRELPEYKPRQASEASPNATMRTSRQPNRDAQVARSVLNYIASPYYSGKELGRALLGEASLELWNAETDRLYFSLPAGSDNTLTVAARADAFVRDSSQIHLADTEGGYLVLDGYALRQSEGKSHLFVTDFDNVKVATNLLISFDYERASYTITPEELSEFLSNKYVYGGFLNVYSPESNSGQRSVFANHGAFVATPNEPSLKRFADVLIQTLGAQGDSRESRIQIATDFVTSEIEYNFEVANFDAELLKRPNEVLMTRRSDCSNKVILLASLLEQMDEEYLLVYMPEHIAVAVERGDFVFENKLGFSWQGKQWLIVESTAEGFQIGRTSLRDQKQFAELSYVQRPKDRNTIYDFATGRKLEFR
jgi:hypothetical protein